MAGFEWERGHQEEKAELIRTAPMLAGKEQLTAFVLLLLSRERWTACSDPGSCGSWSWRPRAARCAWSPAPGSRMRSHPGGSAPGGVPPAGLDRVVLHVKSDPATVGGFRLEGQGAVYDRSVRGRLERLAQGLQGDFDADSEELRAW